MMWRRTAKLASAAFLLAACAYATIVSAQTGVPEPGKSKKIDEIKKRGVLKAAAIGEFPWLPENTSGSGPQFSGPAWLLAEDIAKRLGAKLEIVAVSHETKVPILATGQADITIAPLTITPARQKVVDFIPYSASSLCFFGLANNSKLEKLNSVDDINSPDITMAYFTGTPPETWAPGRFPKMKFRAVAGSRAHSPGQEIPSKRAGIASIDNGPCPTLAAPANGLTAFPQ